MIYMYKSVGPRKLPSIGSENSIDCTCKNGCAEKHFIHSFKSFNNSTEGTYYYILVDTAVAFLSVVTFKDFSHRLKT